MTTTVPSRRRRRAIAVVRVLPVPVDLAVALFSRDPELILGSEPPPPWSDDPRADVGLDLPGGCHLGRAVRIGFGPIIDDDDARALPVWWEDADHPDLFPTFDGGIELRGDQRSTELRLVGSYQPPLGTVGRFADSLVGHRVALASLESFLAAAADRLMTVGAARS
jgi:hypothetical protein